jgi:hypothetical protein
MTREKALQLRALLVKASASLSDEDALNGVELFPVWAVGVDYALDIRVRYDGKLFRCVQAHTSQIGWEPPDVPALWTEVAKPGEIPVWKQPTGTQDAYRIGYKVHFPDKDGPVYISTLDYNTYAPDIYGWEVWTG